MIRMTPIIRTPKISFDFHGTLDQEYVQSIAKRYVHQRIPVYVISASDNRHLLLPLAEKLGIHADNVYTLGNDAAKIEKIKELGITTHYDNNEFVIEELPGIGILVK